MYYYVLDKFFCVHLECVGKFSLVLLLTCVLTEQVGKF